MSLYKNCLRGPIPDQLRSLVELLHLHMEFNELTGKIPEAMIPVPSLSTPGLQSSQPHTEHEILEFQKMHVKIQKRGPQKSIKWSEKTSKNCI